MGQIGHNSMNAKQLESLVLRVEKLSDDRASISADIRDVFAEAKGNGFDVRAMREAIKLRKLDAQEREERENMRDTYLGALDLV